MSAGRSIIRHRRAFEGVILWFQLNPQFCVRPAYLHTFKLCCYVNRVASLKVSAALHYCLGY